MTIETRVSKDDKTLVISISGNFDFTLLNEFRKAYSEAKGLADNYIVDLRSTPTIDSSALGMLLNMQRHLNQPDGKIKIINCNQVVSKVLRITSFDKKFILE